ncbi:MAG: zinc ribbon domain-containing protein [Candidatus Methanomethylicaceae archaeon]
MVSKRSKSFKRRLNNWWFRKFLNMLSYKSLWEGVKAIESKHTSGSSTTCPMCESKLERCSNGQVVYKICGFIGNRHIIACLNLLRWEAGVRPRPLRKCSCEASPIEAWSKSGEVKSSSIS